MKKLTLKTTIVSSIIFIFIWSTRTIILKPIIDSYFDLWTKALVNGFIKVIIWLPFALYLIKKYDMQLNIKLREMFITKINLRIILSLCSIFLVYVFVSIFVQYGDFSFSPMFHPSKLIGQFLLVGLLEEIVFRGWFLNAFSSFMTERKANIISSIPFILVHYPSYIVAGLPFSAIALNTLCILILSLIFGWSFYKNHSIITPIILHMVWDLLIIVFLIQ